MARHALVTPAIPQAIRRAVFANRKRIFAREAAIAAALSAAWHVAQGSVTPAQHALINAYGSQLNADTSVDDNEDSGHPSVPMTWAHQSGHLAHLQRAVMLAVGSFAVASMLHVTDGQQQAVQAGATDAQTLIRTALQPHIGATTADALVRHPNSDVLHAFIGRSQTTGKPLADLLATMDDATAQRVTKMLYAALATGAHPDTAANMLTQATGMAQRRALVVARTEIMGAYRSASLTTYRANVDVCDGWTWMAAQGACDICAALDGTLHPLSEDMESHPNCRCCPAPHVKSADDLSAVVA